jgi:hypothetical protein
MPSREDVVPVVGRAEGLVFDGRAFFVWWGRGADELDRVGARGGRLLTFPTAEACRWAADEAGWAHDLDESDEASAESVTDLEPALRWLQGRAGTLDPEAGLNLWNWADDVARSTGRPLLPHGGVAEACYRKLFAANVPWFFELAEYRPVWRPRQLTVLRRVLASGVHVLRASMPS